MIEEMLDQLAEFQAQADLLEMDKRRLLDEVKIPAEVLKAQDEANKARLAIDATLRDKQLDISRAKQAEMGDLTEPEVPPEFVAAMAAYRAQLEEIESQASSRYEHEQKRAAEARAKIDAELQAKVQDVYAQVAQRKQEISAEFDDKASGVLDNIAKLTAQIKAETRKIGHTVKGQFWQAVYVKGRITWKTDKLDEVVALLNSSIRIITSFVMMTEELSPLKSSVFEALQTLADARKEGEPSVSLRKI